LPAPLEREPIRQPARPLRRADQAVVATCVAVGLVALLGYWVHRGITGSRLIDIDRAEPLHAQFQLDINQAEWPELVQLPGIGEVLARRIVEERQMHGAYLDHRDLQRRVRGIGAVSLDRMRPYLLPMADTSNVAEGEGGGSHLRRGS